MGRKADPSVKVRLKPRHKELFHRFKAFLDELEQSEHYNPELDTINFSVSKGQRISGAQLNFEDAMVELLRGKEK